MLRALAKIASDLITGQAMCENYVFQQVVIKCSSQMLSAEDLPVDSVPPHGSEAQFIVHLGSSVRRPPEPPGPTLTLTYAGTTFHEHPASSMGRITRICDCCFEEKPDARARAGFYPTDAQGTKSDKAFLGPLCDECLSRALRAGTAEHRWLLKQVWGG